METELKNKAKKDSIHKGGCGFVMFSLLAALVAQVISLKAVIYVIILIALATIWYFFRELRFINKSRLTYGTVVGIKKSDPEESQVYQYYVIEYIDEGNNLTNQTLVYSLFGDNDDEDQEDIKNFFEEGRGKIGKKVPLLYMPNNDKRTMVFLD